MTIVECEASKLIPSPLIGSGSLPLVAASVSNESSSSISPNDSSSSAIIPGGSARLLIEPRKDPSAEIVFTVSKFQSLLIVSLISHVASLRTEAWLTWFLGGERAR